MEVEILEGWLEPGQVFVEEAPSARAIRIASVGLGDRKEAGSKRFSVEADAGSEFERWNGELVGSILCGSTDSRRLDGSATDS